MENKTYVSKNGTNFQISIFELEKYLELGYEKKLLTQATYPVTDGIINTAVLKTELESFLKTNTNFRKGYTIKSARRKGTKIFNKNNKEIRLFDYEIEQFTKEGWVEGRSPLSIEKFKQAQIQIHKGDVGKRVSKLELSEYLELGWERGVPKLQAKKSQLSHSNLITVYDKYTLKEYKISKEIMTETPDKYCLGRSPLTIEKYKNIPRNERGKMVGVISPEGDISITKNKNIICEELKISHKLFLTPQLEKFSIKEEYETRSGQELLNTKNWKWFNPSEHPKIKETIFYNDLKLKLQLL